jgi:hypothetical protein
VPAVAQAGVVLERVVLRRSVQLPPPVSSAEPGSPVVQLPPPSFLPSVHGSHGLVAPGHRNDASSAFPDHDVDGLSYSYETWCGRARSSRFILQSR